MKFIRWAASHSTHGDFPTWTVTSQNGAGTGSVLLENRAKPTRPAPAKGGEESYVEEISLTPRNRHTQPFEYLGYRLTKIDSVDFES